MFFEALGLGIALSVLLIVLPRKPREKIHGVYSQPGWGFFMKTLLARLMIAHGKRQRHKTNGTGGYGKKSRATLAEMDCAQQLLPDEDAIDTKYFNGLGDDGTWILVRIARRPNRTAELWLTINVPGVGVLQSPIHPDTAVYNISPDSYSAEGLTLSCIETAMSWRISYNGLLRKGLYNGNKSENDFETVHVKFSFIFNALTRVFDFDTDLDRGILAATLAREPWSKEFFDTLKAHHQTHYEQGGELRGVIQVDGHPEQRVILKSLRDHSYGIRKWTRFHRYIVHFGWLEDGTYFNVSTVSLPDTLSYLKCGWVSYPNAEMHPVCYLDLDMPNVGEHYNPPSQYSFTFKAGFRTYNITVKRGVVPYYHHMDTWENVCMEGICTFELDNGIKGRGISEFCYRRKGGDNPRTPQTSVPMVPFGLSANLEDQHLALPFTSPECANSALVGGKGCQLAQLTQLQLQQFIVPKGFCVGIDAFDLHLQENPEILQKIKQLQEIISNQKDEALKDTCQMVVDCIQATPICDKVRDVIKEHLQLTFGESWLHGDVTFAIRSSAAGEDSAELSAAGQMDTILGVKGLDAVYAAVQKCWASHFALAATQYRRQHGQPVYRNRLAAYRGGAKDGGGAAGMGVVVQEMALAEAAGVLFTRDPVTGNPGLMTLNANYGLGETVVSGAAEPDNIVVSRSWCDELEIKQKDIGGKQLSLVVQQEGGGTKEEEVSGEKSAQCCMSDDVILRLARIGIQLEKHYADARDIEWAIKGENIYILQARPITALDALTDWELQHEFDTALGSDSEILTTGNIGEMMPGAVTPLSISTFARAIDYSVCDLSVQTGLIPGHCDYLHKYMGVNSNHLFLNMHMIHSLNKERSLGSNHKMAELSLVGEVVPEITFDVLRRYHGTCSLWRRLTNGIRFFRTMQASHGKTQKLASLVENLTIGENCTNAVDLYNELDRMLPIYMRGWADSSCSSSSSVIWSRVILAMFSMGQLEWRPEHYSDVAVLLSKCEDVYSADVPSALQSLAQKIVETEHGKEFTSMSPQEAVRWLESGSRGEAGEQYAAFLQRHGHRCIREADFREKSWQSEPTKLVSVLQTLVQASGKKFSTSDRVVDVSEAISQIQSPLSAGAKFALKRIVPRARRSVGTREWGKSTSIRMVEVFKQAYWRLAGLMVRECRLPDPDLLMFFTHKEIQCLLQTRSGGLVAKAQRRRRMLEKQMSQRFRRINFGHPVPIEDEEEEEDVITSTRLTGLPVSRGVVKGTARVVKSLEAASQIQPGDILIVHFTDVGWTPYFPLIGGLVTEIGGLISHGAVVAREYGLPCIVNCRAATRNFKSGDTVILNGSVGTIEKVVIENGI